MDKVNTLVQVEGDGEPCLHLSEGGRMVWAAVYALEAQRQRGLGGNWETAHNAATQRAFEVSVNMMQAPVPDDIDNLSLEILEEMRGEYDE